MRQPDQKDQSPSFNQVETKDGVQAHIGLVKLVSMGFTPFFRKGVGDRYYWLAIITLAGMVAFVQYAPPLLVYIPIWLLCLFVSRVDKTQHSQFSGWSRLTWLFRSERVARIMEPLLIFSCGIAFVPFNEPFSEVLMAGSIAVFCELAIEVHSVEQYQRRMRDAQREMEFMSQIRRRRR